MGTKNKRRGKGKKPRQRQNIQPSTVDAKVRTKGTDHECRSAYAKYKKKTRAFRDGLAKLLPSTVALTHVSDLGKAVDYVFHCLSNSSAASDNALWIQKDLLLDLKESIELRESFTEGYLDGGDEGHMYMVGMLKYCHDILAKCRALSQQLGEEGRTVKKSQSAATKMNQNNSAIESISGGQFEALRIDQEEEESDEISETEAISSSQQYNRAVKPVEPKQQYSIEKDLIEGSYKFQANQFIWTMDTMFTSVNAHFKELKESMRKWSQRDTNSLDMSLVILELIQSTAAVNMALEDFRAMEETFYLDCPHLPSFYHVLAGAVWSESGDVVELQEKINPKLLSEKPTLILDHIARCIESGFRNPLDQMFWKGDEEDVAFAKAAGVTYDDVMVVSRMVRTNSFFESTTQHLKKNFWSFTQQ